MAEEKNSKYEAYMEMQNIDQQLKQLQEYSQNFETQALGISEILESLDDFEKSTPGSKIFVPLQNGIFVEAKLGDSKKVKVNVGSGIVVEKTVGETKEMMEKQLEAVKLYRLQLNSQIEELTAKLQELEKASKE